jgi:hypothetical protein
LPISQGEIFEVNGSPWIVVDNFHNNFDKYTSLHCAPLLEAPDLRLELDVPVSFEMRFASLGLMQKLQKALLRHPLATAHSLEVEEIRKNLVTWFSVYSFDFDTVRRLPPPQEAPPTIYPGMIFSHGKGRACVVDHWGCFNDYPLLYVAPAVSDLSDLCPLDVEISAEFPDLFSDKYFIRTDDFYLVGREELEAVFGPRIPMLGYGLVRKITRALILKFGQLSLLL